MQEAVALCQQIAGRQLRWTYSATPHIGDHIWYISDTRKFQAHYPQWRQRYDLRALLKDIHIHNVDRWLAEAPAYTPVGPFRPDVAGSGARGMRADKGTGSAYPGQTGGGA
jgi:hypothetical protein